MAHATTSNLGMQDFFTTTLNGNVASGDTVINLNAVPTASEGYLVIDPNNPTTREVIYYTSKTSGSVTCPDATAGSGRGVGGTSVQAHTSGTLVEMRDVAEYWQALQNGESLSASAISSTNIATNGVAAQNLATNAITLGYAQMTAASFTTNSATPVQVTGLTVTVTIPAGGRRVRISVFSDGFTGGAAGAVATVSIWDGTVGSGTKLSDAIMASPNTNYLVPCYAIAIVTPSAGSKTYNVGAQNAGGSTTTIQASTVAPAFILVEAI